MIRIITDTSALYTPQEAEAMGLGVVPLSVTINNKTYREFVEINADEYMDLINQGHVPASSQPAIGEMVEMFEKYIDDEIIVISVAVGLSGAYSSWSSAVEISNHPKITVINSTTLAYPQRYLVDEALKMRDNDASFDDIVAMIEDKISINKSYLIPTDLGFLKRGGRLTPVAASMAGLLKLQPVVVQTDDGRTIEKFAVARNMNIAVKKVLEDLEHHGINSKFKFGIVHSQFIDKAHEIAEKIKEKFNVDYVEILELSCAFITHGGPQCLAIQVIKE